MDGHTEGHEMGRERFSYDGVSETGGAEKCGKSVILVCIFFPLLFEILFFNDRQSGLGFCSPPRAPRRRSCYLVTATTFHRLVDMFMSLGLDLLSLA